MADPRFGYLPPEVTDPAGEVWDHAAIQRMLRAAQLPETDLPDPVAPPSPGLKLGRFSVGGDTLDSVSAAILQQLQNTPPARSGAGGFAQGFASGYAGTRMRNAQKRREEHEQMVGKARDKGAAAQRLRESIVKDRENFRQQRTLATQQQAASLAGKSQGDEWIDLTPEVREWARQNHIAIAPGITRVKAYDLTRNMPVAQPGIMMSPEALQAWSQFVATTGTLPSGVARNTELTTKLLEGAVPFLKQQESFASNRAGYRADATSLNKLQSLLDGASAFENTALRNMAVLDGVLSKIPDTGSPVLNVPFRAINRRALGSGDMAAYEAARTVIIPEFARLLQSATLAGQLTDEARKEVRDIVQGGYTIPQMRRVFDVLKQDAINRKTGYQQQINEINARISGRGTAGTTAAPTDSVAAPGQPKSLFNSAMGSFKPRVPR